MAVTSKWWEFEPGQKAGGTTAAKRANQRGGGEKRKTDDKSVENKVCTLNGNNLFNLRSNVIELHIVR